MPIFRIAVLVAGLCLSAAWAHDNGQWENSDPAVKLWFKGLMQPDNPGASCCGEADAYWADDVVVVDGKTFAIITDTRDDKALGRPHIAVGTRVLVPDHKLKWDRGNPTGHNVLFVGSWNAEHLVYCFVQGSGT